jgi:hypothetical protein
MLTVDGRIWFHGNPWPDGHRIVEASWTGRLDGTGQLWFDLSLKTAHYDDEYEPADSTDDEDAWGSPIVWNNYHACRLSSTSDDATGLLAAAPGRPFSLTEPRPQRLTADPLPLADPDAPPAFHVYLLGHDSVADHDITFTRQDGGGYHIEWTGRVALTYAGDEEFRYAFRAEIHNLTLEYVDAPATMPVDEARRELALLTAVPDGLTATIVDGRPRLYPP